MRISKNHCTSIAPLLLLFICLLGLVGSTFFESRAYFLGFLISLCFLLMANFPTQRCQISIVCAIIVIGIIALLFTLKLDSSLGRILIYKISFKILLDNFFIGIGFGEFKRVYLIYQGTYFSLGNFTKKELLLADNTVYAFNDYLQIIIEWGVIGWMLVLIYFLLLIKIIQHMIKRLARYLFLTDLSSIIIITLSTAALFTPVFQKFFCQLLFLATFPFIVYSMYAGSFKQSLKYFLVLFVFVSLVCSEGVQHLVKFKQYEIFSNSIDLSKSGFKSDGLNGFKSVYEDLKNDGYFLSTYGRQLADVGRTMDAIKILQQSLNRISNSENYLQLADCYFLLKQFPKAEDNYKQAVNMVPNRFRPRFSLFLFYKKTGQFKKAQLEAQSILELPVKIPSPLITTIISTVKEDLER